MFFLKCTSYPLVCVSVIFFTVFLAHGLVSVEWLDGQESSEAEGEVLDVCKVSAINFPSKDHNEHVILESSTHQPHTSNSIPIHYFKDPVHEVIDTYHAYCKVNIIVPPEQNINVTILEADNNDVPSYLYVEKHCLNSCLDLDR